MKSTCRFDWFIINKEAVLEFATTIFDFLPELLFFFLLLNNMSQYHYIHDIWIKIKFTIYQMPFFEVCYLLLKLYSFIYEFLPDSQTFSFKNMIEKLFLTLPHNFHTCMFPLNLAELLQDTGSTTAFSSCRS